MTDTVRYAVGFGPLGELAHRALVRRDVEAIFDFRAQRVPALLRDLRSGPALADAAAASRPSKMRFDAGQVAG